MKRTDIISKLSSKVIYYEAHNKLGIKYHLCKWLLLLNQKYESKRDGTRWFWFLGRFCLPPYWWHTKTFKIITTCLILSVICVWVIYFFGNKRAEDIVNDISVQPQISDNILPLVSSQPCVESSDDRPKMYEGSLVIDNNGVKEYQFLRYDLSDAKSKNSDTIGWLQFPYCDINYPVVQGTDNDYYLRHDFYKNYTTHGWIYRDYRITTDDTDNIVIYGHNLYAGGMFTNLLRVIDCKEPLYVLYQTEYETGVYEVISAYRTEPEVSYIQTSFNSYNEKIAFYNKVLSKNEWGNAPLIKAEDINSMLTLSTCYGDDRYVVHCRLVAETVL